MHAVGRHVVIASRSKSGNAFGDDEGLAGEILRHAGKVGIVVVVAYDVERSAAEEVVAWIGLVTAGGDGARGVERANAVGELLRQQHFHVINSQL